MALPILFVRLAKATPSALCLPLFCYTAAIIGAMSFRNTSLISFGVRGIPLSNHQFKTRTKVLENCTARC